MPCLLLCAIVRRLAWQADQQSDKLMQAIHGANGEVSAMHFLAARDAVSSSAEQVRARVRDGSLHRYPPHTVCFQIIGNL